MSDPRPLAERIEAALTPQVLHDAYLAGLLAEQGLDERTRHFARADAMRAVLTSALLAALEPKGNLSDNPLTAQLLDLITLMPDSQTQEILDYITDLRAIRARRDDPAEGEEHFCVRCHHRWTGDAPSAYCGDCHRLALAALEGQKGMKLDVSKEWCEAAAKTEEAAGDLDITVGIEPPKGRDWLDEIEANADDTSPFYLPRLIAEIRRLRAQPAEGPTPAPWDVAEAILATVTDADLQAFDWTPFQRTAAPPDDTLARVAPTWQPIETAPSDGTPFLAYGHFGISRVCEDLGFGMSVAHWSSYWKSWRTDCDERFETPTHWQPLPDPPHEAVRPDAPRAETP